MWPGQRSAVYAKLYSYTTIALGVGPLITAIVFQVQNRPVCVMIAHEYDGHGDGCTGLSLLHVHGMTDPCSPLLSEHTPSSIAERC